MSFRLLSVVVLLGMSVPAVAKPPELPLDPTDTCSTFAAEVPVDGLLLAAVAEQKDSWTARDLVLETLVPALRLRHLSPERVKATVDELRPQFHEMFEKWQDLVAQCPAHAAVAHEPPACGEQASEECEAADDIWEAEIVLKNRRSGEVVHLPNVTIVNGKACPVIDIDGQNLHVEISLVEQLSVMPRAAESATEEADAVEGEPELHVGQIVIIGNTATPEEVIRQALPFAPGDFISHAAVRQAEKDLRELHLFADDDEFGFRPTVTVLEEDGNCQVKDILVTIAETPLSRSIYNPDALDEPQTDEAVPETEDAGAQPVPAEPCPPAACPPAVCPKPATESVCPYMRQKCQPTPTAVEEVSPGSVEENLEKLLKARKAMRKADKCRDAGDLDAACKWYEKVKQLCPGSRFDQLASQRLDEIASQKTGTTETEDPEECPPGDAEEQSSDVPQHDCVKFFGRMFGHKCCVPEKCRARLMAVVQVYCASCWHCDGCTLFWKAHACMPLPESSTTYPGCKTEEDESEQPPADAAAAGQPYDVPLQPCLPEVDPKIVDALEKVLQQSGDPEKPKLILIPEEPGDVEPQDEPVAQWPLVPQDTEMPSLYVDPDEDDLDVAAAPPAPPVEKPDVAELLREVLGALQNGVYVDVSGVDPESLETRVSVRVGGIECSMMADNFGNRYFLVGLLPEATRNVKVLAQSLNERVLRWIELSSSGGNKVEEAEDGSDEEPEDLNDSDEEWEND